MTPLEKRLIEDMKLVGYSKRTQDTYLYSVAGEWDGELSLSVLYEPSNGKTTPEIQRTNKCEVKKPISSANIRMWNSIFTPHER